MTGCSQNSISKGARSRSVAMAVASSHPCWRRCGSRCCSHCRPHGLNPADVLLPAGPYLHFQHYCPAIHILPSRFRRALRRIQPQREIGVELRFSPPRYAYSGCPPASPPDRTAPDQRRSEWCCCATAASISAVRASTSVGSLPSRRGARYWAADNRSPGSRR